MLMKLNSINNTKVSDLEGKLKAQKEFPSDSTSQGNVKSGKYIREAIGKGMEFKFFLVSKKEKRQIKKPNVIEWEL